MQENASTVMGLRSAGVEKAKYILIVADPQKNGNGGSSGGGSSGGSGGSGVGGSGSSEGRSGGGMVGSGSYGDGSTSGGADHEDVKTLITYLAIDNCLGDTPMKHRPAIVCEAGSSMCMHVLSSRRFARITDKRIAGSGGSGGSDGSDGKVKSGRKHSSSSSSRRRSSSNSSNGSSSSSSNNPMFSGSTTTNLNHSQSLGNFIATYDGNGNFKTKQIEKKKQRSTLSVDVHLGSHPSGSYHRAKVPRPSGHQHHLHFPIKNKRKSFVKSSKRRKCCCLAGWLLTCTFYGCVLIFLLLWSL